MIRLTVFIHLLTLGFVLSPRTVSAGSGCTADLTNKFPSVVRIAVTPSGACTGFAVNPYQIVTAGHCLMRDDVPLGPHQLKIHTSSNSGHVTLDVRAVHIHEKYEKYGKFDIAVVDLNEPAETFSRIARDSIKQGDRVNIGGYGVQSISGYGPSSTIRNMGENWIDLVDEYYLTLKPVIIPPAAKAVPDGSPCIIFFGDSGGGVGMDNKMYGVQTIGTRIWERDGTIIHQDRALRLDAPGIKEFLTKYLDASSWE